MKTKAVNTSDFLVKIQSIWKHCQIFSLLWTFLLLSLDNQIWDTYRVTRWKLKSSKYSINLQLTLWETSLWDKESSDSNSKEHQKLDGPEPMEEKIKILEKHSHYLDIFEGCPSLNSYMESNIPYNRSLIQE